MDLVWIYDEFPSRLGHLGAFRGVVSGHVDIISRPANDSYGEEADFTNEKESKYKFQDAVNAQCVVSMGGAYTSTGRGLICLH